jgi:hypothetical protein
VPEYRKVRAEAGSFLDLCYAPTLAAEVTLQPIRRFGFDAAILFFKPKWSPSARFSRLPTRDRNGSGIADCLTFGGTDAASTEMSIFFP